MQTPQSNTQTGNKAEALVEHGGNVTGGAARSLHSSAVPIARIPTRAAPASTGVRWWGRRAAAAAQRIALRLMLEAPKVRVNLFPERVEEKKDWWGYLNIKESDLEQWVLLLADPKNVSTSQNGEREFVIPVIGFNVEEGTPSKGIRIMEKQLGAKARNSTVNRPQRKWG